MPHFTSSQKRKLIERFELQREQRKNNLERELEKLTTIMESKVSRKLALVPKKFAELRIKDVLTVERDHKIKIYELIKDVDFLHKKEAQALHNETQLREEFAKLKKKKQENMRTLQKRKESMAMMANNRVSKPSKTVKKRN
ncbi:CYFA0S30e01068g1_1 [Cyberlindnera fabianii]|uniref:CYFA0S30e01068g1_1 n=1 Tax=Cyberlindnera fabianii TaxID=36022 RepID=A0A061BJS8_CYBFA|nr:CYFA0S30e01068g1_1 [Cyberlindnera fabianii]